jgi:hypothetical protein
VGVCRQAVGFVDAFGRNLASAAAKVFFTFNLIYKAMFKNILHSIINDGKDKYHKRKRRLTASCGIQNLYNFNSKNFELIKTSSR